jgi:RNA polymerase sigma-70 factor (ECF subfamily)
VPLEEERSVVARLRHGDRAAFAVLYRWYGDAIWRVIVPRLPDRAAAEDCLRDTFRTALEKLDQFRDEGQSIFWWIRRIAIHKAMDAHRLRKRDRELVERVVAQPEVAVTGQAPPRPDRGLELADTARDVQISLSQLNERYARVLALRLLEDRPREECAELLGVTLGTLDVLLHRACKAFRKVYPP